MTSADEESSRDVMRSQRMFSCVVRAYARDPHTRDPEEGFGRIPSHGPRPPLDRLRPTVQIFVLFPLCGAAGGSHDGPESPKVHVEAPALQKRKKATKVQQRGREK